MQSSRPSTEASVEQYSLLHGVILMSTEQKGIMGETAEFSI